MNNQPAKIQIFTEKRIHPRIPVKIPVQFRVIEDPGDIAITPQRNKVLTGQTENVSLGGLCMISDHVLDVGSILRLNVNIPEISKVVLAFAAVVWSIGTETGLHFEAVKEEDLEVLYNFLSQRALNDKTQ